jgi:lipopolysaccharide biosynthesis glycosyltransferase
MKRRQPHKRAKAVIANNRNTAQPGFRIAVVYVCDANYHDLTIYSLGSIARAHRAPLDFFLLQSEYLRAAPDKLLEVMAARHHLLSVRSAPTLGATIDRSGQETRYSRISAAMFLKASAIDALAGSYDYVLYVDGDTLAFDDLHCEQIAGFPELAAVCLDLSSATGFDDPGFFSNCERNGVSPEFFNSGVMMINSRKWLETRASARFMENVFLHERGCPYFTHCAPNDQCALNMTFGSDLKLLPISWNVQKSALQTRTWESALVRHYTGAAKFIPVRPWTCDRREHALVKAISRECGLPLPRRLYDFGFSYQLNKIRRHRDISRYEHAIQAMIAPQLALRQSTAD